MPNFKNRVDEGAEQAVISYAVDFPAHGQHLTSNELRKRVVFVSGTRLHFGTSCRGNQDFEKHLGVIQECSTKVLI